MATTAQQIERTTYRRLSVARVAVASSLSAVVFVILCWIGGRIGLGPATHMYVNMFSDAGYTSVAALLAGVCWSLIGGAAIGAIYALIYNALAPLER